MATKKDLVEAHSFSKRRLVTAFISGAPGGREVEPVRPGRVLIGGVAISLLLLAGAAIAGFLIGRPNSQWLEAGSFVTSKDTGEQYVVLEGGDDPVIRRVPNYISAQLLLGESDLTPFRVRDKYIREVTLGEDLGIDDAPAGLPDPEGLIPGRMDGVYGARRRDPCRGRTHAGGQRAHRHRVPGEQRRGRVAHRSRRCRAGRTGLPVRAAEEPDTGGHDRRPAGLRRPRAGARGEPGLAQPVPAR
ncbi:type VII secretion protein EccB [Nocardioides sp. B-3]|uniref:type VII secretion protein EccB n=1 Tax=Nocardioides sp. B-3 TaxID=2895565 RepID=UPI0021534FB9|nr:type VII secretion protein EccB [Nocardioides sp. B-3]UUZ60908.1 type VII secretion protein EccB [Nocardioides sp. B-3]